MKRQALSIVLCAAALAAAAGEARAQETPRVGVTMGYPSAVGVIWQVADRVALRPDFTWAKVSTDSSSSDPVLLGPNGSASSDTWQTGFGLSALFFLSRTEAFRTYVSPRFSYTQSSVSQNVGGSPLASGSDLWSYVTSGSFGAQYTVARHFGIFGEVGLSYSSATTRTSTVETVTTSVGGGPGGVTTRTTTFTLRSDLHTHTLGTRSGVGVIFYF
jgi:hypothetical protein